MELRDIEIFLTLAEELHFGRTAERLHVSPARISQAIKKQERAVGGQLRDDLLPVYRTLHESMSRARLNWGLVWRSEAEDDRIRALADIVRELGPRIL